MDIPSFVEFLLRGGEETRATRNRTQRNQVEAVNIPIPVKPHQDQHDAEDGSSQQSLNETASLSSISVSSSEGSSDDDDTIDFSFSPVTTLDSSRKKPFDPNAPQSEVTMEATPKPNSEVEIVDWDGKQTFSDLIYGGFVEQLGIAVADEKAVLIALESPSSVSRGTSRWKMNGVPTIQYTSNVRPLRLSCFNGNKLSTLVPEPPHPLLLRHWKKSIPGHVVPTFIQALTRNSPACLRGSLEGDRGLIGTRNGLSCASDKTAMPDVIISKKTGERPSANRRGPTFVIRDEEDEQQFRDFLEESIQCVDRTLSCHFFIQPKTGNIIWFGSSESLKSSKGKWSSDATFFLDQSEETRELLTPYAQEVANYLAQSGYWGFCGISVLLDHTGTGHIVDVNPRASGSMSALMVGKLLFDEDSERFAVGKFRRSARWVFPGSIEDLLCFADFYNDMGVGKVVVLSASSKDVERTRLNVAVYGESSEQCDGILSLVCMAMASRKG